VVKKFALGITAALVISLGAAAPANSADASYAWLVDGLTEMQSGVSETTRSLSVAPQVGWNAGLEEVSPPKAAGYRLWDMKVAWRDVNPSPGVFDWSILDRRIAQVESWGGRPLLVMGLTPEWAAADPSAGDPRWGAGTASPPADPNSWAAYVRAVSERYGDRIGAYELWNEANLRTFWTGTPEQMAELVRIAYPIIKQNSPSATVLSPSVTTRLSSGGRFTAAFLEALAEQGVSVGNAPFDAFAIHTYPKGNAGVSFDGSCNADPSATGDPIPVGLPEFSKGATEATFVRWLKETEELVAADEPLFEVSSGGRSFIIPSTGSGVLQAKLVEAGDKIRVGDRVGIINNGETPDDCVSGRNARAAASERVADVVQWQQAVISAEGSARAYRVLPVWDTEINYGLAGPGITPGVDWSDAEGARLMRYTFADSAALGIENTFWYQFTARPFDLLGVQMNPGTSATLAAFALPYSATSSTYPYSIPIFAGCRIDNFVDCEDGNFKSENLSLADVYGVDFAGADFYRADLTGSAFVAGTIPDARFFEAQMARFVGNLSDFSGSNMRRIKAPEARFVEANLTNVDFRRANLRNADFQDANLRGANFIGADLRGANFCNTDITGTKWSGAKIGGTKCLRGRPVR